MNVVVNAAMSADGKLSSRRRDRVRISGPKDFARVDAIRADCDGVAVGIGTVLADDPHLTVEDPDLRAERRERGDPEHPARVVIDTRARTPTDARVLDDAAETHLLVGEDAPDDRRAALRDAGAHLVEAGTERVDLAAGLDELESEGIDRLLIEGGGELLFSAFTAGVVDDLSVYVGSLIIGGRDAPTLADGEGFVEAFPELTLADVERLDDGVVLSYAVEG
ncbi:2,5-diamino-6-(ribosylamino)-4(3H)-pyrimidinone 5'-phosphate reductase [Halococcus saccharolyticus]|uniref:2,5-diamino-6-(ribosylamino)-4(3H)-pyrimidinone 5'-phosphate reductase n=1 Tax=Halococcus saccharolyticus DSM 5350 TaxID=1227455 RepID=M0MLS8_9EURY|nr:2,5-diamino-6-(ribosylamino)-4(3H)-pyrimidinone 5'-phosphate reductase [Halococcus saccharolyticus]EMA45400.1 5-amino-6-(5-phosphoribosylamino)uracil reductase [Halococcus saccharolyticus DSM 5350]